MAECGCGPGAAETVEQRRTLKIALGLNAAMFLAEVTAGIIAGSSGLIADGLDMLADASAYAIALMAIGRSDLFKAGAARGSGFLLLALGTGVLVDVARRSVSGAAPEGVVMIAVAAVAVLVNSSVLKMLTKHRDQGVHLNTTWVFTRVDVIANLAVIVAGIAMLLTGFRFIDLAVGAAIGMYVIKEAVEILRDARQARDEVS